MRFEVLEGKHSEGGTIYKKGAIVETHLDLCAIWNHPNALKFRKLSDGPAPAAVAASKAAKSKPEAPSKSTTKAVKAAKPAKGASVTKIEDVGKGENVTKSFPFAEEECFTVFKKGDAFHVFEDEDDATPIPDGEGITESEVEGVIKKFLAS